MLGLVNGNEVKLNLKERLGGIMVFLPLYIKRIIFGKIGNREMRIRKSTPEIKRKAKKLFSRPNLKL